MIHDNIVQSSFFSYLITIWSLGSRAVRATSVACNDSTDWPDAPLLVIESDGRPCIICQAWRLPPCVCVHYALWKREQWRILIININFTRVAICMLIKQLVGPPRLSHTSQIWVRVSLFCPLTAVYVWVRIHISNICAFWLRWRLNSLYVIRSSNSRNLSFVLRVSCSVRIPTRNSRYRLWF